jgi:uncharacterized protein YchJ
MLQTQGNARNSRRWGTLQKVGQPVKRNAACPCGSGRKFKKCCLPKCQKQIEVIEQARA